MTMSLRRQTFTLELEGVESIPDGTVEIECINPDYLRAEQLAPKLRIDPKKSRQTFATLLAYCACKRLGIFTGDAREFLYERCVAIEAPKPKDAEPVDPTAPEAGTGSP